MDNILFLLIIAAFGYAIYLGIRPKKELKVPTKEEIKAKIDAIEDLDELKKFAIDNGVDEVIVSRPNVTMKSLTELLYKTFNLS